MLCRIPVAVLLIWLVWARCRASQSLWRPNVPEYFAWKGINGLFVFAENKCLNQAWISLAGCPPPPRPLHLPHLPSSHTTLFTHIPGLFCSRTWLKLKSRLWCEVPHSASRRTFPADYKELFFRITFPPLWPNLAPCSAFSQHRICHIWSQWNSGEIIDVLHYSAAIRYGISFLKIPNFNLVKQLADWTISAVPSNSKPPRYLQSGARLSPV